MLLQDALCPQVVLSSADHKFDLVVGLKLVKIIVEIVLALTATGALEIHYLNHSRVHAADIDTATGFEQNSESGAHQAIHQRIHFLLQKWLTARDFDQ